MTLAWSTNPTPADEAFAALEHICQSRGLAAERKEDTKERWLRIAIQGKSQIWDLEVDCSSDALTRLPPIKLGAPTRLLSHVGYDGTVCVSDHQGLSLDTDRRPEIAAVTLLSAYDLLEKWSVDASENAKEFYNELEGYWLGLPDSIRARATFEVDGKNRILWAYGKTNGRPSTWYLTEWEEKSPLADDAKKLPKHRALYVHLTNPIPPPVHPHKLDVAFIEAVCNLMTADQQTLWRQLIGPSNNSPKQLVLMVSYPRDAGGLSVVGALFGAKMGQIDPKAPVKPLTVRRHTPTYMRERGGASLELLNKHVVVLGCGAVGSVVADSLAATGVGHLTLVDHDHYSEDNVFRHIIDPCLIDQPKVTGLRSKLTRHYPGLQVTEFADCAEAWLKIADFSKIDAVIVAFGLPTLERWLCREIRAQAKKNLPMLFTWLEPLDLGGHSVVIWTENSGCLECLYRDEEGNSSLRSRTSFLEPDQTVSRNLTGCTSIFVPYGALQSRRTGLMAAEHLLTSLKTTGASYRYWVGDGTVAAEQGWRTTPWRDQARSVNFDEATRRVLGMPCKRCRGAI